MEFAAFDAEMIQSNTPNPNVLLVLGVSGPTAHVAVLMLLSTVAVSTADTFEHAHAVATWHPTDGCVIVIVETFGVSPVEIFSVDHSHPLIGSDVLIRKASNVHARPSLSAILGVGVGAFVDRETKRLHPDVTLATSLPVAVIVVLVLVPELTIVCPTGTQRATLAVVGVTVGVDVLVGVMVGV